ncbi:hypothetical protein Taro_003788 [Colocasia esculenta]|uniref:Uncharacterized protein n=1 Tax=Colocasia esculenta TaxID=4460 RepID=A0A843TKN7_COLES|nr:hypothetical protein [Colocasia esculenta]
MYMDVDDRMFVPPSDVYMVTCLYVCHFVTPENLNTRLDECRFLTPEELHMGPRLVSFYDTGGLKHMGPRRVSFYDTGGLKHMANGGLVTTCGVSMGQAQEGPATETKHQRVLTRAAYVSSRTDQPKCSQGGSAVFRTSGLFPL